MQGQGKALLFRKTKMLKKNDHYHHHHRKHTPKDFQNLYVLLNQTQAFNSQLNKTCNKKSFQFQIMLHIFLLITIYSLIHIQAEVLNSHNPHPIFANTCRSTCGSIPVRYPIGTGFGCGHPEFSKHIECTNSGTLMFSTRTGTYPISSIDYISNIIILTDPLMSNCTSMQNSGSFGLDPASPFKVTTDDIFVLLGCSTTSPIYDSRNDFCATGSASHVCRGIYSCKGVTGIGLEPNGPISTCCVYDPQMLIGSGYKLDLPKLQCSSYTCINGFGDDEGNPNKWNYGISLQFNSSYDQTDVCKVCETSGGTCGFMGLNESFACVCRNGVNITANCYGQGYAWSGSWKSTVHKELSIQGLLFSILMVLI